MPHSDDVVTGKRQGIQRLADTAKPVVPGSPRCIRQFDAATRRVAQVDIVIVLSVFGNGSRRHTHYQPPIVTVLVVRVVSGFGDVVGLSPCQLPHRPLVFYLSVSIRGKEITAETLGCFALRYHERRLRSVSLCYADALSVECLHSVHSVSASVHHDRAADEAHFVDFGRGHDHLHPRNEVVDL